MYQVLYKPIPVFHKPYLKRHLINQKFINCRVHRKIYNICILLSIKDYKHYVDQVKLAPPLHLCHHRRLSHTHQRTSP